jgi:cytidylate kinase
MIITISREFAAGGSEIARLVADRLGWTLVDNQVIDEVAARAGLTRDEVAEREERAPGFVERLARTLATSVPEFVVPEGSALPDSTEEMLVRITERVVAELAAGGRVVMVGRAAPAVLASHPAALHVRVVAPRAVRIERAMARLGLDRKQAEKLLDETDANRARYHRQYYGRDWVDPINYHLTLNSSALGLEGSADVIVSRAKMVWRV